MSTKFTPGPWKLAPYNSAYADNGQEGGDNDVVDGMNRLIAEVSEWADEGNPNAVLISQAPDLYEALTLLQSSLPDLAYLIGALKRAGMDQEDLMKVMEAVGRMDEVLGKIRGGGR